MCSTVLSKFSASSNLAKYMKNLNKNLLDDSGQGWATFLVSRLYVGRRSASWAGLLEGSSSIFSTTTIVRVTVIGREKKKVYTLLRCPVFLPKISVKQWGREKLQKGGHNFHIFLIVFLFSRTTLKLIEKQEKL